MTTLREASLTHKAKKELYHLASVPIDIEIKQGKFKDSKTGQDVPYSYIEIEGYKYTINSKLMSNIRTIVATRPTVQNIKFERTPEGQVFVIPLD